MDTFIPEMLADLISWGWEQVAGLFGATEISDLIDGARSGYVGKVQALLDQPDVQVNEEKEINGLSYTPLLIAAEYGNHRVVKLLLKVDNIQVNFARKGDGSTALFMATKNGHLKVAEQLLKRRDIDVNKRVRGCTPLNVAVKRGHKSIVDVFLKRTDVDVNLSSEEGVEEGVTPLFNASYLGYDKIVALLLKRDDIDVNKPVRFAGFTPLYAAAAKGYVGVVKLLVNHEDIQVNKADHNGANALMMALEKSESECFWIIVEKMIQPVYENSECLACLDRRPNVVLIPCGHQILCSVCASQLNAQGRGCPIDRIEIIHVTRTALRLDVQTF